MSHVGPPPLQDRPSDGHKGTFGRVLIVAGSSAMPGAGVLATLGALRSGAGLATLAATGSTLDRAAPNIPCATLFEVPGNAAGRLAREAAALLIDRANSADVLVVGPGLGTDDDVRFVVAALLDAVPIPIVLDADGLNAICTTDAFQRRRGPTVATPHPGEMTRLLAVRTPIDLAGRIESARHAAKWFGATIVLKGAGTVVTDGRAVFVNDTGNAGMATGGSGDALAGICAGLIAQGMTPFHAAIAAVHLHGLAGDRAAEARSEESLIATDLLDCLGYAFRTYRSRHSTHAPPDPADSPPPAEPLSSC